MANDFVKLHTNLLRVDEVGEGLQVPLLHVVQSKSLNMRRGSRFFQMAFVLETGLSTRIQIQFSLMSDSKESQTGS